MNDFQLIVKEPNGKSRILDVNGQQSVGELKGLISDSCGIPADGMRLVIDGCKQLAAKRCEECAIESLASDGSVVDIRLPLAGGRLHGQILQKSLLYMRPRGFMGMKNEKLHCLMMTKLVNTRQIHLLTLVKYFYARMALFHFHPSSAPGPQFARMRAAELQRKPFLFPRH